MPACRHLLRDFIFLSYSYWIDFCRAVVQKMFDFHFFGSTCACMIGSESRSDKDLPVPIQKRQTHRH